MTNEERIALAMRWHLIDPGDEWSLVCRAANQLRLKGRFPNKGLTSIVYQAACGEYAEEFERLVQRVLELKLLGDTK